MEVDKPTELPEPTSTAGKKHPRTQSTAKNSQSAAKKANKSASGSGAPDEPLSKNMWHLKKGDVPPEALGIQVCVCTTLNWPILTYSAGQAKSTSLTEYQKILF